MMAFLIFVGGVLLVLLALLASMIFGARGRPFTAKPWPAPTTPAPKPLVSHTFTGRFDAQKTDSTIRVLNVDGGTITIHGVPPNVVITHKPPTLANLLGRYGLK